MSLIEIDSLLSEISPEQPCGEDLEYDARFGELERAAQGKPEQQYGDTLVPAEAPDWREVRRLALELSLATKDLRVLVLLIKSLLATDGLSGFAAGLTLLRQVLERYWQGVYPLLDPDDDNDPTFRNNILLGLCDPESLLSLLRETPIVVSRSIGRFSLRDVQRARGQVTGGAAESAVDPAALDAAMQDCPVEALQATSDAVIAALDDVAGIEAAVAGEVGVAGAPSLKPLSSVLKEMKGVLGEFLQRRGVVSPVAPSEDAEGDTAASVSAVASSPLRINGEITSRDDAIRALDKVCEYFYRHEPSSPVPLVLQRAKRLVTKDFMDILRDMAPEALAQAQLIVGSEE